MPPTPDGPEHIAGEETQGPQVEIGRDVVARLRQGESDAFVTIFRAYYAPLVRFLTRYTAHQDGAEDLAQETFIQLWNRRAEIDPGRSVRAYLYTSARNRALNLLAHHQVVQQHVEQTLNELGPGAEVSREAGPDRLVETAEIAQIAEARVAELSPRLREIYQLSRNDGLTPSEISDVLGTSVQTVYKQLSKLLEALNPLLASWVRD